MRFIHKVHAAELTYVVALVVALVVATPGASACVSAGSAAHPDSAPAAATIKGGHVARDTTTAGRAPAKPGSQKPKDPREERWRAIADSLHINEKAMLSLHAVPRAERRSAADVSLLVHDCDQFRTAVAPGDWDVFLVATGFDLLCALQISFDWPEDWILHGFTLNPDIKNPIALGGFKSSDRRPYILAFNCVAHPDRLKDGPEGVSHLSRDLLVIGRLEITATSPGSLSIADHPDPVYGAPELISSWRTAQDVPPERRGRIDVGVGPGVRPCAAPPPSMPRPGPKAEGSQ